MGIKPIYIYIYIIHFWKHADLHVAFPCDDSIYGCTLYKLSICDWSLNVEVSEWINEKGNVAHLVDWHMLFFFQTLSYFLVVLAAHNWYMNGAVDKIIRSFNVYILF